MALQDKFIVVDGQQLRMQTEKKLFFLGFEFYGQTDIDFLVQTIPVNPQLIATDFDDLFVYYFDVGCWLMVQLQGVLELDEVVKILDHLNLAE